MRLFVPAATLLAALAAATALAGSLPALAAGPEGNKPAASAAAKESVMMDIEAQTTTYDGKAHTYQVKGDVRIRLPQLLVRCQRATVFADPGESRIMRVIFEGDVVATRGSDSFKATQITYWVAERRLEATGATQARLKLVAPSGPVTKP